MGSGEEEEPDDSGQRARKRRDDDEGIKPALEVDDDESVDEDDGKQQAGDESHERGAHGLNLAADEDLGSSRELAGVVFDDLVDSAGDGGQIGAFHRAVDVDNRPGVVVAGGALLGAAIDRCEIAQNLRGQAGTIGCDGEVLSSCRFRTSYCGVCTAIL